MDNYIEDVAAIQHRQSVIWPVNSSNIISEGCDSGKPPIFFFLMRGEIILAM